MFVGRKIKKLLDSIPHTEADHVDSGIISDLSQYGKTAVRQIIDGLEQRKIKPEIAQTLLGKLCDNSCMEIIVPLLGGSYYEMRRISRELILNRWRKDSIPLLIKFLSGPDAHCRDGATEILAVIQDKSCVQELVSMFNSADTDLKPRIIKILGRTGGHAARSLAISALNDDSPYVRISAVKCLGRIKDPESVEPLIEKLSEEDPRMKKLAIKALGELGDKRAAHSMITLLKDDDMLVRQEAVECTIKIADSEIVPDIINFMRDADVNVRRSAVEVLNNLKDPRTIAALITAIKDSDWWVRQVATDSLIGIKGDMVVKSFIAMAYDDDENIRRCSVEFFNEVPDAAAVEPLIALLKDHDWWVREKAATALGKIKDKRAIEPLAAMIDDDEAKSAVPAALASIGGEEVVEPLMQFLFDDHKLVRLETMKAFGVLKVQEVVPHIQQFLDDPNEDVRAQAVATLKAITGKLFKASKDGKPRAGAPLSALKMKIPEGATLTEAVLVLDLCNSTDIAARYGDSFVMKLLETLDKVIGPIGKKEKMQFQKSTGDGFLITFPKVVNSIRFSFELYKAISHYNKKAEKSERINLRIGINLGETRVDKKGDRIGLAVNMAFRAEGVKPDGLIPANGSMTPETMPAENRILITENVEKEMEEMKGIKTSLVGLFELKGITGLHKIYHLTLAK